MKLKIFVLTALSLAGVALSAAPVSAWCHHHCGCNRFSTTIVCRPYNAFTPVCCGSLVCDGCCPFPSMGNGAACGPVLSNPMLAMTHNPLGINAYQMPPMMVQAPSLPTNMPMQMPMTAPLMPTGYQPSMTPVYYPIMPAPANINPYQQVPAYWYGN